MQATAYGACGDADRIGYLTVAQPPDVVEKDSLATAVGKLVDSGPYGFGNLATLEVVLWGRRRRLDDTRPLDLLCEADL